VGKVIDYAKDLYRNDYSSVKTNEMKKAKGDQRCVKSVNGLFGGAMARESTMEK
jgi:hypothetical protein